MLFRSILLAAKFSSQNASHPWATGVTLYKGKAIATNNVAFVAVKCDTKLEGLVPPWAIAALRAGALEVAPLQSYFRAGF